MNETTIKRLEAWFDGECSPKEVSAIEELLQDDPEARAYVEQLEQAREALRGAHVANIDGDAVWESFRERLDEAGHKRSAKVLSFPQLLATAAAVMLVGMGIWFPLREMGRVDESLSLENTVYSVETELEGATPIVYIDEPSGWTVVWVVEAEEAG